MDPELTGFLDSLQVTADGEIRFQVRVTPRARRPGLGGLHDGALRVAVNEIAEDGKANRAVVRLLAKQLGLSRSQVSIDSGHASRVKAIHIGGLTLEEARCRLHDSIDCAG